MDIYADEFFSVTGDIVQSLDARLKDAGGVIAYELQEAAKREAPWKDNTGNARRTITGSCDVRGKVVTVCLAGMMPYSPELELGYERRYSVLLPVLSSAAAAAAQRLIGVINPN